MQAVIASLPNILDVLSFLKFGCSAVWWYMFVNIAMETLDTAITAITGFMMREFPLEESMCVRMSGGKAGRVICVMITVVWTESSCRLVPAKSPLSLLSFIHEASYSSIESISLFSHLFSLFYLIGNVLVFFYFMAFEVFGKVNGKAFRSNMEWAAVLNTN